MDNANASTDLSWLLDDLVERVISARHAVVLSADGLLMGQSNDLSSEDGEHLAAMASAFQSLARGTGRHFSGGEVRQTIVEMDHALNGACMPLSTRIAPG